MNSTQTTLASLVSNLTELLSRQEKELHSLTDTLQDQRKLFVSSRTEDLEAANEKLEVAAKRCLELEHQRLEHVQEIATFLGLPSPRVTARKIAAALKHPSSGRLVSQAERTKTAAERLRVESKVGESLLAWSARCHEGLMRSVAEALSPKSTTYDNGGKTGQDKDSPRMLDAVV